MSFAWKIEDASGRESPPGAVEEIDLEDLTVASVNESWKIEDSDLLEHVPSVSGGQVGIIGDSKKSEKAPVSSEKGEGSMGADKKDGHSLVSFFALLFGLGFLAVVVKGVVTGDLDFQVYMGTTAAFLAGLGIGRFKNQ